MDIGLIPISSLNKYLSDTITTDDGAPWFTLETETILLALGTSSRLLREKISLLKVIGFEPELFFSDPMFFLHATEVMNNTVANFEFIPVPTSLEIAFAIVEIEKIVGELLPFKKGIQLTIQHILTQEGYSITPSPFDNIGGINLAKGQYPEDSAKKSQAIKEYINGMYSKSTS